MKPRLAYLALLIGVLAAGSANAEILWSQMNYLTVDLGPQSSARWGQVYDDFWFDRSVSVQGVSWAGTPYYDVSIPFGVEIWSGVPDPFNSSRKMLGAQLAAYEFPAGSLTATRIEGVAWTGYEDTPRYRYDAVLDTPFMADADTDYFLIVCNSNWSWPNEFYWQMVTDANGQRPRVGTNTSIGSDVSFELRGTVVPEPATAVLLFAGLVALVALRRRVAQY